VPAGPALEGRRYPNHRNSHFETWLIGSSAQQLHAGTRTDEQVQFKIAQGGLRQPYIAFAPGLTAANALVTMERPTTDAG